MEIDQLAHILEMVPTSISIVIVILFLKYIQSRDKKDVKMHKDCESTIKAIITVHDKRVESLIDKLTN